MTPSLVARILEAYGITPTRTGSVEKGYRNESHPVTLKAGQRINVLLYKREPDILSKIMSANAVSGYLAGNNFPARSLYDPRVLQIRAANLVKYCCIYHYLPGKTIPWEAYTKEHLKQLGAVMSDMHALLVRFDAARLPHAADEYATILKRMEVYFGEPGVQAAMRRKLQLSINTAAIPKLQRLLAACRNLSAQTLHMDFVRGNILFSPSPAITGVLDFEKTAYGPPAFDVARTLAFLLVDCKHKSEADVRKYFLHSGYAKRGNAGLPPLRLVNALVPLFLLHDFYKFLRHNPYESLHQNEHYIRTRDMLLASHHLSVIPHPPVIPDLIRNPVK